MADQPTTEKPKRGRGKPIGHKMTDEHRAWLVTRFAQYPRSSPEVLAEFKEHFGFEVEKRTANNYNFSNYKPVEGCKKNERWLDLHHRARAEYDASIVNIAVANPVYRMNQLDKMFHEAMDKRNFRSAAALLEQAAKEVGGAFSNRRVVEGNVEHKHEHEVPQDIMRSAIAHKVRDLIADGLKARAAMDKAKALPASDTIIDG